MMESGYSTAMVEVMMVKKLTVVVVVVGMVTVTNMKPGAKITKVGCSKELLLPAMVVMMVVTVRVKTALGLVKAGVAAALHPNGQARVRGVRRLSCCFSPHPRLRLLLPL
jgi:hypothetical protein